MKKVVIVTSIAAAAILAGCFPSSKKSEVQNTDNTSTAKKLDQAQADAKETGKQIRDYSFAQKTEFVAAMQENLAQLNRSLDEIAVKIEKSNEAVKAESGPKLAALREQATKLNKQLEDMIHATPSTWDGIKADAERAYAALKDGLTQSRQWASDKIAP